MALPISFDYGYLAPDVDLDEVKSFQDNVDLAHKKVTQGGGLGSDFLGWVDPAKIVSPEEVKTIKTLAAQIRDNSDVLISIGIGGSYLGARAVIEALGEGDGPEVMFAGNSLSAHDHAKVLKKLDGKRFSINAISKSGTTTEPAVAFRLFRDLLEKTVGKDEAKKRIVATTDAKKGALRKFAEEEGYATLNIADDVGGRYSVLSPVGLLPIAVAGIDIDALLAGAKDVAANATNTPMSRKTRPISTPPPAICCTARATQRRYLPRLSRACTMSPNGGSSLTGESEGKEPYRRCFPASVDLTTDLHSMGQWIQQGRRNIIETFVILDGGEPDLTIPAAENDLDELGYLQGRPLAEVNKAAYEATSLAHRDGGVPNSTIHLSQLDAYSLGALLYFFERAIGVSGYLMGINPFNQPGVEAYKTNMFALLGKPKFEKATEEVKARLAALPKDTVVKF